MTRNREILTEYECGACEGEGELYKDKVYAGICVDCNGTGITNTCWEGE